MMSRIHDNPMPRRFDPNSIAAPRPRRRPPERRPEPAGWQIKPRFWAILATFAAAVGLGVWRMAAGPAANRPDPPAPALTGALKASLAAAIEPKLQPPYVGARIEAVAPFDGGLAVSYVAEGLADEKDGARWVAPGLAVVEPGERPAVRWLAPGFGGWNGPSEPGFEAAAGAETALAAVPWRGKASLGVWQSATVEARRGGRLEASRGRWIKLGADGKPMIAFETPLASFEAFGAEVERETRYDARFEDVTGDGRPEILLAPRRFVRTLTGRKAAALFEGPGAWAFGETPAGYARLGLVGPDRRLVGDPAPPGAPLPQRLAPPMAPGATVDGADGDWAGPAAALGLTLLPLAPGGKPSGSEDFAALVGWGWDARGLWFHATVTDDAIGPGDRLNLTAMPPAGAPVSLDLGPGAPAPEAGILTRQAPLKDPFNQAVRGWKAEALIPWKRLGMQPPSAPPAAVGPRLALTALAALPVSVFAVDRDGSKPERRFGDPPADATAEPAGLLWLVSPRLAGPEAETP